MPTYVQRSGQQLTLGGKPFNPMGFNVPYVISNATYDPLAAALALWPKTCNAARTWVYQALFVKNGAIDWTLLDSAMAAFEALGIYAVLSIGNQYGWNDGVDKDVTWYTTGYKSTILAGEVMTYRDWVKAVVTRYAGHPNVLCWEFMNEPKVENATSETQAYQALLAFLNDLGALTNGLDTNHLFALGNCLGYSGSGKQWEGSVQMTVPPTAPVIGEADWQLLAQSQYVDLLTYHDYGFPLNPMGYANSTLGITAALAIAKTVNKPLFIGEQGIDYVTGDGPYNDPLVPATTAERAALFHAKWKAEIAAGVCGVIPWAWRTAPKSTDGVGWGMEIGPGDPILAFMDPSQYTGTAPPPPPSKAAQVDAVLKTAEAQIATILAGT